ncbi:MAG: prephenate dehydrogenase/arogenate dehydrogenase family protein, partial [Rhodobacteraceae bacterium]|nr:prephenate dehydrogenase/arogenate dehydrogenase family protein [Paracoccaceae bacterium]
MFKCIALIGMGLIASSIARAVRQCGLAETIEGYTRSRETATKALELGLADTMHRTPESAVAGADLVIFCTPVKTFSALAEHIGPHLKPGAIVSDVGSVKRHVLSAIAPHIPAGVHFIPGHPLAGTEESGPQAGFAELFTGRWCLLTPPEDADGDAVTRMREF